MCNGVFMSESIRADGLPVLTDCAQCGAATFRPVPDDPCHVCAECFLDSRAASDDFDDRGDYEHQINEESDL